jgi:predicted nucleic acid-binding protein
VILWDTGVLLCLVDRTPPQHNAYRATVTGLAKSLITTWSCLTEAMYLALHRGGWVMQKQLNTHQAHLIAATLKVPGAWTANYYLNVTELSQMRLLRSPTSRRSWRSLIPYVSAIELLFERHFSLVSRLQLPRGSLSDTQVSYLFPGRQIVCKNAV